MNRTQKQLADELLAIRLHAPALFTTEARIFLGDLQEPRRRRRRLTRRGYDWLRRLGEQRLGADHELVRRLRP